MKQVLQNLESGETVLIESPSPTARPSAVLIQTSVSLVSSGTERMLVDFGRANLLNKVRQQPDKVKMVLEKIKTDGLLTTVDAVRSKLAQPLPLGYCNVGVVQKIGKEVKGLQEGDRVVSNGAHADVVNVPHNLCAKIPDNVDDESASFTVLASIGLQGIRLANPTLGESFVVMGVGLIGLLTVQLLRSSGCRVLAIDFDEHKLQLARQFGATTCNLGAGEDPVTAGLSFSRGHGVDGVIITASTSSNDPVSQAARMSRKRGRIILVGVVGLSLSRADFYEKELTFQVSCSYGPGRYDPQYEDQGQDYPFGFVRWTEKRNFEAVLDMMATGRLDVRSLITHRFAFDDAPAAYDVLSNDKSSLGILLQYSGETDIEQQKVVLRDAPSFEPSKPVVAFIGAGNYASRVLIPAFKSAGAQLHTIVSAGGVNGVIHGKKAGFAAASTSTESVFEDSNINTAIIATRHNTHAELVTNALKAGKHVFVEKPLATTHIELDEIRSVYLESQHVARPAHLMVGFNRRFSPHAQKMKSLLASVKEPKTFIMTMNAGIIPPDHWVHDIEVGGGRIIGEACHFVDLMRFLAGCEITSVQAQRMGDNPGMAVTEDKATILLGFADGSFGSIHYLGNGSASFPKERVEVFAAGRVLQLDNFRQLKGFGWPGFRRMNLWRQDKGQKACCSAFLAAIENGERSPIPPDEIFEVAKVTIQAAELLRAQ